MNRRTTGRSNRRSTGRHNVKKMSRAQRWTVRLHHLKRLVRVLVAVAVIGISAYGGHLLYGWVITTPYLQVQGVDVEGHQITRAEDIRLIAGQLVGIHQTDLDLQAVEGRVERLPWVLDGQAHRLFPDRVHIEVRERQAVAILVADDLYYVDESGAPFLRIEGKSNADLPLITGLDDPNNMLRKYGRLGRRVIREALALVEICEAPDLGLGDVSEIHVSVDEGLSVFFTGGGSEILLGWEDYDVKLGHLIRLQNQEGLDLHAVAKVNLAMNKGAVVTALPTRVRRR